MRAAAEHEPTTAGSPRAWIPFDADLPDPRMARLTINTISDNSSLEPPPLASSIAASSRRILWIVGLFRAGCGAMLLGLALLLDLRTLNVAAPNSFLTAASLY